jgi:hypothetical protein
MNINTNGGHCPFAHFNFLPPIILTNRRSMIDEEAETVGKTWREVRAVGGNSLLALLHRGRVLQSGVTAADLT